MGWAGGGFIPNIPNSVSAHGPLLWLLASQDSEVSNEVKQQVKAESICSALDVVTDLVVGQKPVRVPFLLQQVTEDQRVSSAGRQTDRHFIVDRFMLWFGARLDEQLDDWQVPDFGGPVERCPSVLYETTTQSIQHR